MPGRWNYQSIWGSNVGSELFQTAQGHVVSNLFVFHATGFLVGYRFYREQGNSSPIMMWWNNGANFHDKRNVVSQSVPSVQTNASRGWQHLYFHPMRRVVDGQSIMVYCWNYGTLFRRTPSALALGGLTVGDLEQPVDGPTTQQGYYGTDQFLDTPNPGASSRWGIDVLFLRHA